jgi:hypothetical protein
MSQSIKQRLESSLDSAAASGRKIASYMLANLHELPFQTSASIAAKLGVSESSVGRFCRALGYAHLKALKQDLQNDLGDGPWLVGDRLQEFRQQPGRRDNAGSLELEIAALVRVHEYSRARPGTPWPAPGESPGVHRRFPDRARHRPVHGAPAAIPARWRALVDGSAGHFGEVLLGRPRTAPWWCSKPAAIRATPCSCARRPASWASR